MATERRHLPIETNPNLDFPLESKIGPWGPFSQNESLIVLVLPFTLGLAMALLIHAWFILSIVVWYYIIPNVIMRGKKNKPKSWLWDWMHKHRLQLSEGSHFKRPKTPIVFTGRRALASSAFTRAGKGGLVPIAPQHLTVGLPVIRVYDAKKQTFKGSITAQPSCGKVAIMSREYRIGARRLPEYRERYETALDPRDYHQAYGDFIEVLTPVKPSGEPA